MNHIFSSALEFSKHPLVVLVAGAIVGSIVVPRVNARMERSRRLHELKIQRATAALKSGFDTERRFNSITTAFQSFYKDEVLTGTATEDSRQALRMRVYERYQDFDQDAWWWHWETLDEVRILKLIGSTQVLELEQSVKNYQAALLASTDALDPYWEELLRHSSVVPPEKAIQTLKEARQSLEECRARRREALMQMVKVIIG